jgi:hypothetical protein
MAKGLVERNEGEKLWCHLRLALKAAEKIETSNNWKAADGLESGAGHYLTAHPGVDKFQEVDMYRGAESFYSGQPAADCLCF